VSEFICQIRVAGMLGELRHVSK